MADRPSTDLSTPVKFGDVAHEPNRLSVDSWQKICFGELAFHISDRVDDPKTAGVTTYVGLEHLDSGSLKIKRCGTPDDVNATKLRVKPGQIIFGKRRAYQRKVAVADFDGICSAHAMVLEANPKTTAPGFLPFFMQSNIFFDRALAISEGSLSPTIKWKTLAAQEFLIPPIARQKELVSLFQAIEDAIAATEESLSAAEELKRSLLFSIFSSERALESVSLESVAEVVCGLSRTPERRKGEYIAKYLRVENLRLNSIDFSDVLAMNFTPIEQEKYLVKADDILLVGDNANPQNIGACAIYTDKMPQGLCFQNHIIRLRSRNKEELYPLFLYYYINKLYFENVFAEMSSGTTIKHLKITRLASTKLEVPSYSNQEKSIELLSSAYQQVQQLKNHRVRLKNLRFQVSNPLLSHFDKPTWVELEKKMI